jgi:hypothetical protein
MPLGIVGNVHKEPITPQRPTTQMAWCSQQITFNTYGPKFWNTRTEIATPVTLSSTPLKTAHRRSKNRSRSAECAAPYTHVEPS